MAERILITGAGLAGSLMSLFLARRGYDVQVAEMRPDMRRDEVDAGRSINLALSHRGLRSLAQVGLTDAITEIAIPMPGRMIHDLEGHLEFQPYGQDDSQYINSISRSELNKRLLDAAEATGNVEFFFGTRCSGMDLRERMLHLRHEADGRTWSVPVERVIACDGAGSPIRISMLKLNDFRYDPQFIDHGYKELTIPAAPDGSHLLDVNALHIWPRGSFMLIALPNPDGTFTGTLFLAHEGETDSFAALEEEEDVQAFFEKYFADVLPLMPNLLTEFFENPTGPLGMIKSSPWYFEDAAVLMGDAAHPIVPFYGQGMNAAFEDCFIMDQLIDEFDGDWKRIFRTFFKRRKPDADAIADLAMRNFVEMRDKVADPKYVLSREVALELERRYPGTFIPLYSMVSFTSIPYAEAKRRGEIQAEILAKLVKKADTIDDIKWKKADKLIHERLTPVETVA